MAEYRIGATIQQSQPDGSLVKVEFGGLATNVQGTKDQIGEMLLEAERHGNDGKSRVHLVMVEEE